ncbi:unnamed protein product [Phyllotreta striolata]|uniref:Ima1 N-terminal domain-containing protein n=1 Tax=Phyllotreta striolata TaxID=444603 RepID=A0A9N9TXF5_PHYSR|nr:unnamed protein product [Phyllotreta striolata]
MNLFLETLVIVGFWLAAFLLAFLVILNLYLIKRNGFYISVNCWFCNKWSKVRYESRNSFECPVCLQYNGFKPDGSYNKVIEAQHETSFVKYSHRNIETYDNGLCTYCNNNQQLKIHQLAKFAPIREENYDLEIEHFKKQLEKVYKLCKKCNKVLKSKIDQQHSWLFGKRLKDIRRKGASLLTNKQKSNNFLGFLRHILIIISITILCHILNIRIVYPNLHLVQNMQTNVFIPYETIFVNFSNVLHNNFEQLKKNVGFLKMYLPSSIHIQANTITVLSLIGWLLDLILSMGQKRYILWKAIGQISWFLLLSTFSITLNDTFAAYISSIKLMVTLTLLYYYFWIVPTDSTKTKDCQFKKLAKHNSHAESFEEETDEDAAQSFNASCQSKATAPRTTRVSPIHRPYSPMEQDLIPNTARSATSTSDLYRNSSNISSDLNSSLDNLHLGHNSLRCSSPNYSVKRSILSPAKLGNVTQNPWTAGGFWKNDATVFPANIPSTNLSRSSSQSSGFGSTLDNLNNHPFSSLPASREPSINGEADRVSILSEPAYHFTPINANNTSPNSSLLYYKAENNTFYPVLNQNSMLFIQNGVPQQGFCNNSIRSFDVRSTNSHASFFEKANADAGRVKSADLFNEKPISPLFKNLHLKENFRKPRF